MFEHENENDKRDDTAAAAPAQSHPFYCPGCGRRWNFQTECVGLTAATPHPPIEVVSTDELNDDSEEGRAKHTPAPGTAT